MADNKDDLENFDDSQFDNLDADLDTSAYDDPSSDDLDADLSDDLAEDSVLAEDDFGTDDNWDDQAADGQYDEPAPQKKKSSLLTYVIVGVVVLAGGAFAFTKLGGSPAPQQQPAEAVADAPLNDLRDEAAQQAALEAPVAEPIPSTGDAPPALPSGPALTALDTPAAPPAEDLPSVPNAPPAEVPADPAVIGGLKPVSDFPSVDLIKKSDIKADSAPAVPVPDAPAGLPVAETPAPPVNSAELTVLQGKLDAAQNKINALEKDLVTAKAVNPSEPTKSDAQVKELEEKVSSLEKKLAAKAKEEKAPIPSPVVVDDNVAPTEPPRVSEPVQTEPERVVSAPTPVAVKKVAWDLRGAQPGKAMLAQKGSDGDIRTVSVGDSLPGLGKIVSISQTASGWVVKGTQGTVTQ